MALSVVFQQVKVDGHDAIFVMNASDSLLRLLQYLSQQPFTEGCRALAELVQIWFLPAGVHRFRPNGGGEMHFRQQLCQLFPRLCQIRFLILVRSERDDYFVFPHILIIWCKDNVNRVKNQIKMEISLG